MLYISPEDLDGPGIETQKFTTGQGHCLRDQESSRMLLEQHSRHGPALVSKTTPNASTGSMVLHYANGVVCSSFRRNIRGAEPRARCLCASCSRREKRTGKETCYSLQAVANLNNVVVLLLQ